MLPRGLAARSGLRVGDRILAVNGQDVRAATHQEAVGALLRPCLELALLVRRDPPPPGLRELSLQKAPGEKLGISIRGGAKGHAGNPCDPTDEGIFISKVRPRPGGGRRGGEGGPDEGPRSEAAVSPQVSPTGAAGRDGRLRVGLRLLEVNQQSLLGLTHAEAVQLLRQAGDTLTVLVCDGFDAPAEVSAGRAGEGAPGQAGTSPWSRPLLGTVGLGPEEAGAGAGGLASPARRHLLPASSARPMAIHSPGGPAPGVPAESWSQGLSGRPQGPILDPRL